MKRVRVILLTFTLVSVVSAIISIIGLMELGPLNAFFYLGSALFFFWLYLNPEISSLNVKSKFPRITETKSWALMPAGIVVAVLGSVFV